MIGVDLKLPFPRLTYTQAMEQYGSDKPDLRYGLEHSEISEAVRGSTFRQASSPSAVRVSAYGTLACASAKLEPRPLSPLPVCWPLLYSSTTGTQLFQGPELGIALPCRMQKPQHAVHLRRAWTEQ